MENNELSAMRAQLATLNEKLENESIATLGSILQNFLAESASPGFL